MRYVIGIDEAGRGPLAGPVSVAAVALPERFRVKRASGLPLRDSKKLTPRQRAEWFLYIKEHPGILYTVSRVYPEGIDRLNITKAASVAATRSLERLVDRNRLSVRGVFLDAGLVFLGDRFQTKSIVKGDEKIKSITLASIVAKETRDQYMVNKHQEYPEYGFDSHKGYGTKVHVRALKKHGRSPIHRLTFLSKYDKLIPKHYGRRT